MIWQLASYSKQMSILLFIDCLKCYSIATYCPMCWEPCGVPRLLDYNIPSLRAAGWPEHPWVLLEHPLHRQQGGLECGRMRQDGEKATSHHSSAATELQCTSTHPLTACWEGRKAKLMCCQLTPSFLCKAAHKSHLLY